MKQIGAGPNYIEIEPIRVRAVRNIKLGGGHAPIRAGTVMTADHRFDTDFKGDPIPAHYCVLVPSDNPRYPFFGTSVEIKDVVVVGPVHR